MIQCPGRDEGESLDTKLDAHGDDLGRGADGGPVAGGETAGLKRRSMRRVGRWRPPDCDSASVLRRGPPTGSPLHDRLDAEYIAPTLQFLPAVTVYAEPFDRTRAGAVACIWVAVALFAFDSVRRRASEPVVDASFR
jgi:hypothetical protein